MRKATSASQLGGYWFDPSRMHDQTLRGNPLLGDFMRALRGRSVRRSDVPPLRQRIVAMRGQGGLGQRQRLFAPSTELAVDRLRLLFSRSIGLQKLRIAAPARFRCWCGSLNLVAAWQWATVAAWSHPEDRNLRASGASELAALLRGQENSPSPLSWATSRQ